MNKEYLSHEIKHISYLRKQAQECALFLKRENNDFPLNIKEKKIYLVGSGVRDTIKGGTGSGSLDIHYFNNIEDVFLLEGYEITSKSWLDQYEQLQNKRIIEFRKQIKKEAKEAKMQAAGYSIGRNMPEGEYDFSFSNKDEPVIYVLKRNQGEGQDRAAIKGDFYLTDTEIKDIKILANSSPKFLLVLNTASPIDLSPILDDVDNILLLSQLGQVTSEILFDIVVGKVNPSGKLAESWRKLIDYPSNSNFGHIDENRYQEDLLIGYRDNFHEDIFEFGFGKNYSKFEIIPSKITKNKDKFIINCLVKNISSFPGKEVVQLYLSKPSDSDLFNPHKELVAFIKTSDISPNKEQEIELNFSLSDFTSFASKLDSDILPKGIYLISVGNSSKSNEPFASIEIKQDIVIRKYKHIDEPNLDTLYPEFISNYEPLRNHFVLDKDDFNYLEYKYFDYSVDIPDVINNLSDEELILMSIGDIADGIDGIIGNSCFSVLGGAGETCRKIKGIPSISMADGPAGLRICKDYLISKGKKYKISNDPLFEEILLYLPLIARKLVDSKKNRNKKGQIYHQYTTSIPVSAALAQSFNLDFIKGVGNIVKEEMELYNVDVWLAPAINIKRHPLCGRNFEYFSEDPFLTGKCASALTSGVQDNPSKGVVIKHFCCNNQEYNRTHNDSIVSIRALREIYLKGFYITIKEAKPFGVMASYNLVNGEHVSASKTILNDILRCEMGFEGLIMTDWIGSGDKANPKSIKPSQYASDNLVAGLDLNMPGYKRDIKHLKKSLKLGKLTREVLLNRVAITYYSIGKLKQDKS